MSSSNIAVIALVFLIGLVLGGAGIWLFGRRRTPTPRDPVAKPPAAGPSFRISFIILPAAVAFSTIIALAILYPSLPAELAFRFTSSGEPQSTIDKGLFIGLMIGAQIIVVGLATAVAFGIVSLARRMLKENQATIDPGHVIWLMVNMLVLPQLLVAFVALDAAYYAFAETHIMTPWLFSILAIAIGTLAIIALFSRSFNEARRAK